jgi:WD40 repeat protein
MAKHDLVPPRVMRRLGFVIVCALSVAPAAPAEEPLPPRALARLGTYQFHHGPGVSAVISHDGTRIASVSWEGFRYATNKEKAAYERVVVLWDSATGERLRELQVPHAPARTLRFSSDGKRLAVGYGREEDERGIALFDVATGKLQTRIEHSDLRLVDFSWDGQSLLCHKGFMESLVLWDLENAKQLREWKRLEGPSGWIRGREYVWRMVPSANATFIASLVDEPPDYSKLPPGVFPPPHVPHPTVLIMSDGGKDKPLYRKEFPEGCLDRFVFSANGHRFATGGEKITVYETATGKELFALDAKSAYSFALSPDGRWVVVNSGASQVQLWNLETKKPSHELFSGLTYVSCWLEAEPVFSADGKTVVLTTHSTLRVFDTATGKEGKERLSLGHRTGVTPRFSADGKTLFTTCDEFRRSWDVSALKKPTLLTHEARNAREGICGNQAAAHSPDGRFFIDEVDHRMRIRDTPTGRVLHTLEDDGWSGTFGRFSSDGARLALRRYLLKRTPDGGITTSDEPDVLRLYDTKTGKKTGDISLKNGLSWVVPVFSPDGKSIGWVDRANAVHLHDSATGKLIRTFHSEKELPNAECNDADLLFSPDGKHLIVTTYQHDILKRPDGVAWVTLPTRVFHVASGREVSRFYTNPETTNKALQHSCTACSPDGRLLAVAEPESGTVRLLDTATGKLRAEFAGHRHGVHAVAFSPDGKTLASGGEGGVVYLWDVTDLRPPRGPEKKD